MEDYDGPCKMSISYASMPRARCFTSCSRHVRPALLEMSLSYALCICISIHHGCERLLRIASVKGIFSGSLSTCRIASVKGIFSGSLSTCMSV